MKQTKTLLLLFLSLTTVSYSQISIQSNENLGCETTEPNRICWQSIISVLKTHDKTIVLSKETSDNYSVKEGSQIKYPLGHDEKINYQINIFSEDNKKILSLTNPLFRGEELIPHKNGFGIVKIEKDPEIEYSQILKVVFYSTDGNQLSEQVILRASGKGHSISPIYYYFDRNNNTFFCYANEKKTNEALKSYYYKISIDGVVNKKSLISSGLLPIRKIHPVQKGTEILTVELNDKKQFIHIYPDGKVNYPITTTTTYGKAISDSHIFSICTNLSGAYTSYYGEDRDFWLFIEDLKTGQTVNKIKLSKKNIDCHIDALISTSEYTVLLIKYEFYGNAEKRQKVDQEILLISKANNLISTYSIEKPYFGSISNLMLSDRNNIFYVQGDRFIELEIDPSKFEHVSVLPKIYVFSCGISEYSDNMNRAGARDLNYSDDDADFIYKFYRSTEGGKVPVNQMALLKDEQATRSNVLDNLKALTSKCAPEDLLIFYFSGHGGPDFFVAHDGIVKHEEIKETLNKCNANKKVCFADACYSGTWSKSTLDNSKEMSDEQLMNLFYGTLANSGNGMALFMSSQSTETSLESPFYGHGIFTYFIKEGLTGRADFNSDNLISIQELANYVTKKVSETTETQFNHKQHPQIKGFFDVDMPVGVYRKKH